MESIFKQALALHRAGRLDEAEPLYRQAAGWRPEWTLGNLGALLRSTGRLAEAEAALRRALMAQPGNAPVRHSLGMTLLQAGRYAEGWRLYEARREVHPPGHPPPPFPEWQGEDLRGKRLLVVAEQELGDQIMLARFLPLLASLGAEVTLACPKSLIRLFAGLPVTPRQGWEGLKADYWTAMASAPDWLGAWPTDTPPPYLQGAAPPAETGVGLMLQAAPPNADNASRLPAANVVQAIRGLGDFTDLSPEVTGAKDFAETADIIAGLKLVVTVDTSVAHLAGAMGKPCWVLMCRPAVDWYTNWHDDRTPWYPSMRLFRQAQPGDWAGVIGRLAVALDDAGLAAS